MTRLDAECLKCWRGEPATDSQPGLAKFYFRPVNIASQYANMVRRTEALVCRVDDDGPVTNLLATEHSKAGSVSGPFQGCRCELHTL